MLIMYNSKSRKVKPEQKGEENETEIKTIHTYRVAGGYSNNRNTGVNAATCA